MWRTIHEWWGAGYVGGMTGSVLGFCNAGHVVSGQAMEERRYDRCEE